MENQEGKRALNYKWVVVASCFVMIFVCLGFCSSIKPLVLAPITEALGIKRSVYAVNDCLRYITTAIVNVFFGALVARFGARRLVAAGFLCLTASAFCYALAPNVYVFYIGGILLGAGGLVRAYTKSAKIAVDAAGKSMKRVWTALYVPCPYTFYERVRLEVAAYEGIIRSTEFGAEVELELLFPEAKAQPFLDRLTDLTSGTVEGMETGQEYRAFPVQT